VAAEMVRCHLRTMDRLGIRYDVLPHESDILKIGFWSACFEKLKASKAVHFVPPDADDKNHGCWVMALAETADFKGMSDADKIIVRSNGTVTYVGKDMAYQLWKFGLLGRDFHYKPFDNPLYPIWRTDAGQAGVPAPQLSSGADTLVCGSPPSFGGGDTVINVIDVRQSYLQKIVKEGLRQMGYGSQADRSIHFAYEMVALSQKTAAEFERAGQIRLSDEDKARPYVEMSGRKGLGVQADALLDLLVEKAGAEIRKREPDLPSEEIATRARALAIGALRYYMVKYGRTAVIPFDFEQALAFEGDTGPYLQYACVRAEAILRKAAEQGVAVPAVDDASIGDLAGAFDEEGWAVLTMFMRVPMQVKTAVEGLDLNLVARQFYEAAQSFHNYYHHFPVLQEPDERKRRARLLTVALFAQLLRQGLRDLLGIPVPERM
jgi:arginyl-tRNA synthetase